MKLYLKSLRKRGDRDVLIADIAKHCNETRAMAGSLMKQITTSIYLGGGRWKI